ncbi:MAG: class C sortase [Clostridiales bacterium]|nr:class C sortase [Clostridiales bacterium]
MKKRLFTILLILVFLIGLSLLLYPTVSDYWNSFHQSRAIAGYVQEVSDLDDGQSQKLLAEAKEYNKKLAGEPVKISLTDGEKETYRSLLDVTGTGIIGYIEIPVIQTFLPIYQGTDESVLQIAVGHMEGSSLPVGGESTHCVLSGHRGLPSARLFTNLDQLSQGDLFRIRVLQDTLSYEVDQILVVEPEDTSALGIETGKDYCTLVTCTPYGVNTHRLLVRGHRVENSADTPPAAIEASSIDPVMVIPLILIAVLFLLLLIWALVVRRKRSGRKQ